MADHPPGMLAVPHQEWVWMEPALSLVGLAQNLPPGSDVGTMRGPKSVPHKRNKLARLCLERSQWEWLCFVDADMVCDHRSVQRLLRTCERTEAPIVGALVTNRPSDGNAPVPFAGWSREQTEGDDPLRRSDTDRWEWRRLHPRHLQGDPETVDVDWAGTGLMLVRREILEEMDGPPWFAGNLRNPDVVGEGEDVNFCLRARRELGARVVVDVRVQPGHVGTMPYTYSQHEDAVRFTRQRTRDHRQETRENPAFESPTDVHQREERS